MNQQNKNKAENSPTEQRTWMEQHGATIYGLAVFGGLGLFGLIHVMLTR